MVTTNSISEDALTRCCEGVVMKKGLLKSNRLNPQSSLSMMVVQLMRILCGHQLVVWLPINGHCHFHFTIRKHQRSRDPHSALEVVDYGGGQWTASNIIQKIWASVTLKRGRCPWMPKTTTPSALSRRRTISHRALWHFFFYRNTVVRECRSRRDCILTWPCSIDPKNLFDLSPFCLRHIATLKTAH